MEHDIFIDMCGKFDRKEIILWRADKKSTR